MPKVTVIIPNYNHAVYLKQRIDSVLNQTFHDFDVLILDDCSIDHSKLVIEEYRTHPKVTKIIYNDTNSGSTFKQWAKGIDMASGEYIWIAESDDYADLNFLSELVNSNITNSNVLFSDSQLINERSQVLALGSSKLPMLSPPVNWSVNRIFHKADEVISYFCQTCFIYNVSAAIFKRDLIMSLHEAGKYKLVGDMEFWMNLGMTSSFFYVAKPLNYFRFHDGSVRSKTNMVNSAMEHFSLFSSLIKRFSQELKFETVKILKKRKEMSLLEGLNLSYRQPRVHFQILWCGIKENPMTSLKIIKNYLAKIVQKINLESTQNKKIKK